MSVAIDGDATGSKRRYEEQFDTVAEETDEHVADSSMTYCSTFDCAICT